ncbi:esterase [Paractinoplanes deccanensis]|uniref:Esterase n=1 Tax=Paractinoplanes deccanensis TaxID=113561 RepID=A0ABQ3YEH3_9ACTN|nr:esterase [Actinoplanes deccanensis]
MIAVAVMATACDAAEETPMPSSGTGTVRVDGRQVTVHLPASYDPARPAPLVIGLHGYTSDPKELESYLLLAPESDKRGFIHVYPEGSAEDQGELFWNATDACCDFSGAEPDDSRYLAELIATLRDTYRIDPARVALIGHSNGGFMALRMACDHADLVTAVVSLNGAAWSDAARCRPSAPVSVLAIHSSDDETVSFGGGTIGSATYPSAAATVTQWRDHDSCTDGGRDAPALDVVTTLPGAETSVRTYTQGCAGGTTVQAWTINGGTHVPDLGPAFAPAVTDFLLTRGRR